MPFENLHVVSRGVDTRLFSPSRRSPEMRQVWGAGEHGIVAICVGRMAPEKIFRLPSGRFWQCTSEFRRGNGRFRAMARLRLRARAAAERLGWEIVVDRFESVLRSVIEGQAACV